jgi:transposase
MRKPFVVMNHASREEIHARFKKETNPRIKERLLAILHFYDSMNIDEVAKATGRSESSVKRWLRSWNKNGFEGLAPNFKGGHPFMVTPDQWAEILKEIRGKGMTIHDVRVYIKKTRGIEYSYDAVWKVLRKKLKVRYGKPYIQNHKRPANAEEIFKKR